MVPGDTHACTHAREPAHSVEEDARERKGKSERVGEEMLAQETGREATEPGKTTARRGKETERSRDMATQRDAQAERHNRETNKQWWK